MADPDLTVVVPVWDDYVRFLPECVESIVAQQGAAPLRLVVLDNASRVPLPALPSEVEVVRTDRRLSLGGARNQALERVATSLVAFCDADDTFPDGYFAFALERMRSNPKLGACGMAPRRWLPETGESKPTGWPPPRAFTLCRRRRLFALVVLLHEVMLPMSGSVFRTDVLRRAGGWDDTSVQEEFALATLLPFLADVEVHREPGRRYRSHGGSLAREPVSRDRLEAQFRVLRRRVRRHPDVPLWAKALLPLVALSHRRRIAGRLRLYPPPAP